MSFKFLTFRSKVEAFKNFENELKIVKTNLSEKEDQLIFVQKCLDRERDEKMALLEEKTKVEEDLGMERNQWQLERQELKLQMSELIKMTENTKKATLNDLEINQDKVIKDMKSLEADNIGLKQELKRLQMIIASPQDFDLIRNSLSTNEEDFGYASNRNTLEKHQNQTFSIASSQLSEGDFLSLQNSNIHSSHSTKTSFEQKLKSLFGFSNRGGKFLVTLKVDANTNQTNFEFGSRLTIERHNYYLSIFILS